MSKRIIFISSVQSEFALERKALHEYISADPLLGKFFEPFLFELLPAVDQRADELYLREVEKCEIYLALLGKQYGFENKAGISPTELEFDHATQHHKTRLIFLTTNLNAERHFKEQQFVLKAQEVLVRKKFTSIDELKASVYSALVRYLEEKEIIRVGPFDASFNQQAQINDIDPEKVKAFVQFARSKRGFPLSENDPIEKVLTHLNLMKAPRITNAALLLFGTSPQRFFINSEVRCASFQGTIVEKPIPSYKVFKGTVFELVDQAVDFVLAKLDYSIGTRAESVQIPGSYEIPKEVITEAIVNAIVHRDYTSNASVQVMLFANRLEIWNPGHLPLGWTTDKLKQLHSSVPANPLLAEPMYLVGYIERLGTGTSDIVRIATGAGLKEPEFVQEDDFKTIIYRTITHKNGPPTTPQVLDKQRASNVQVPDKYRASKSEIERVVLVLEGEEKRAELQEKLQLKHRDSFTENYLQPAIKEGFIEMTVPNKPNSPRQKYRLTQKGISLKKYLI